MTDKENRQNAQAARLLTPAVSETLRLYTAWLAVLLKRQGSSEIRVSADTLRDALNGLSCTVCREGQDYVIRLDGTPDARSGTGEGQA